MLILGIETSCDETAASLVEDGCHVLSNVVSSQFHIHARYGGVVPELACRRHVEVIEPVINEALGTAGVELKDVDALAVTRGPGLVGALLVGLSAAKAISYSLNMPLIPVNHIEGHIYSIFLEEPDLPFPFVALVASGGHTELYLLRSHKDRRLLGKTRDDAAGEAFDKVAKMLSLGYPGGPIIDRLSREGNPVAVSFPKAYLSRDSFDFSFSGLKTAVFYFLRSEAPWLLNRDLAGDIPSRRMTISPGSPRVEDVVASFQKAAVDVLVDKTISAALSEGVKDVVVAGGVAANSLLRGELNKAAGEEGLRVHIPRPAYCTDNAAMIACAGYHKYRLRGFDPASFALRLDMDADANLWVSTE